MIAVVTYLWGSRRYQPAHVQRLAQSVARWLTVEHRFVCITDEQIHGVKTLKNPVTTASFQGKCYRRLWLFSEEAKALGDGILHLDLDLVICGSLNGFIRAEDFVIYKAGSIAARGYSLNPSVFWLKPGTQTDIWQTYRRHPARVAQEANAAGFWGSDQAVISYLRKDADVPTFGVADGVVSYRHIRHEQLTAPPDGTRIVSFHGRRSPWEKDILALHPWIGEAWKDAA